MTDVLFSGVKSSASSMKRSIVGPSEDESLGEELNAMCTCSYKTRLYGFGACLVVGLILSLCSFLTFGHPPRFAVIYTLGNIVSLCGTFFLVGPFRQFKLMAKPTRWIAAVIYLLSMIGTLCAVFAFDPPSSILCIICVIIQFCALWWYSLSYVPFARRLVKSLVGKCFSS